MVREIVARRAEVRKTLFAQDQVAKQMDECGRPQPGWLGRVPDSIKVLSARISERDAGEPPPELSFITTTVLPCT
jgi:hypothetical protein